MERHPGISRKSNGKFHVYIHKREDGRKRQVFGGYWNTYEDALAARLKLEAEYGYRTCAPKLPNEYEIDGNLARIKLPDGSHVLVDQVFLDVLRQTRWGKHNWGYALGKVEGKTTLMHRYIAQLAGLDLTHEIDHVNNDKLDNRLSNLRPATRRQQELNKPARKTSKRPFKYVEYVPERGCWRAQLRINGRMQSYGDFQSAVQARDFITPIAEQEHGSFYFRA